MRKDSSDFNTSFISEAGTFATNKDYFAFMEFDDYTCWIAAHGIDSEIEVQSAEMVIQNIFSDFVENPTISRRKIKKYITNAHKLLQQQSRNIDLKASLIMVVTDYANIVWAVSGNGKLHHFRKGKYNFKSTDQSVAQSIADSGQIRETEIEQHPERNNLLNYLGTSEKFKPLISKKYKLADGDVILLSTPGFSGRLDHGEIASSLNESKDSSELVEKLEDAMLNKQKKIINNYTMASIFVDKVFIEKKKSKMSYVKKIAAVMIPVIIIGGGLALYRAKTIKRQVESRQQLIKHEKLGDEFAQSGYYDSALKEYNDAKGYLKYVKDKKKEQQLDDKAKIAEFIVNADKSFESKDYEKAKENYEKAKIQAKLKDNFDTTELDKKIKKADNYLKVLALQNQADKLLENQEFEKAKALYEQAKNLAGKAGFEDAQKDINGKVEETSANMVDVEDQKRDILAKDLEKKGDKKYSAQNYEEAIELYIASQEIYQEINNLQSVLNLERKINTAESALNPVPVVAPTYQNPIVIPSTAPVQNSIQDQSPSQIPTEQTPNLVPDENVAVINN